MGRQLLRRARARLSGARWARLLDRGYQKFIKTSQFELPARPVNCRGFTNSAKS